MQAGIGASPNQKQLKHLRSRGIRAVDASWADQASVNTNKTIATRLVSRLGPAESCTSRARFQTFGVIMPEAAGVLAEKRNYLGPVTAVIRVQCAGSSLERAPNRAPGI